MEVKDLEKLCHQRSWDAGWYHDLKSGELKIYNKGEKLMLMVSELSEAMEGERKNLMDDKLPHRKMAEVELADLIIRCFDYGVYNGYNVSDAIFEKLEYNLNRPDHKKENRLKTNGKKF